MNKKVIVSVVIIVVIVLAVGATLLGARSKPASDNTMKGMDMSASSSAASEPAQATDHVTIKGFAFSPANITVKKGTTVTWTNQDSATHTVTETDGQTGPDSGNLPNGKSYSFTFAKAGTFKYICSIHPNMVGTVTVTD